MIVPHERPVDVAGPPPPQTTSARAGGRCPRTVTGAVAATAATALLLSSLVTPLWQARLAAPQYPGGLVMRAHGGKVTGDVSEINNLNHYVGMRPFDAKDIPELQLWAPTVAVGVLLVLVACFARRRGVARLAKAALWVIPVGVLGDIQLRLWQYGHDLYPDAALRIEEFTPWVLGYTRVWNFRTTATPGLGLVAVVLAAAIVTFGPWAWQRVRLARSAPRSVLGLVVAIALLMAAATPAVATGQHDGATARGAPDGDLEQLLREAPDGATVIVPPGVHRGNFVLDRPVVLDGRGAATLDGGGSGTVLQVRAPGTIVTGLGIRGSGRGPVGAPTGVLVEADDVHVHGLVVEDVYQGIVVQGASGVQVHDNVVTGRGGAVPVDLDVHHGPTTGPGDGISLWDASSALVLDNVMTDVRDGVYVSFGREVLVGRNTVRSSRFGVHDMYSTDLTVSENRFERGSAGLVLMNGGPVSVLRNVIVDNRLTDDRLTATGYGILVKDVVDVRLTENVVARNRIGIQVETTVGSDDAVDIVGNTVAANGTALVLAPSIRADIGGNSFVENLVSLAFTGRRGDPRIDWSYEGAGNFWGDYRGVDVDGDGIGERPHEIGGAVERLLERAPQLGGIAGSAAMGVLQLMEDRLLLADPAAIDRLPLVRPHSPALPGSAPGPPSPAAGALGGALLLGSVATWRGLRSPRAGGPRHALA
ncbi:MAG: right-handed parallel beta-helix repeat-containing protein [Acidimicrobiia bacterium]|nr:right-handed parallel beta-helix repeat-containing protein [Acidimicrobiia bacterium]